MPKPIKFEYTKKDAFRDASLFLIICEGSSTEPSYFRFFEGISSKVKVIPVPNSNNASSPAKLIDVADNAKAEVNFSNESDRLWFVIDTDRWRQQIRELREHCAAINNHEVIQSNPCFEVWLYYHFTAEPPPAALTACRQFKPHLPTLINGGFNAGIHPVFIEEATVRAKAQYQAEGYTPKQGCTQVWELGESLLGIIKKDIDEVKNTYRQRGLF